MTDDATKWFRAYQQSELELSTLRTQVRTLREALQRLDNAVDVFRADQSRATDPRVGRTQPVTVAECEELNAASREARKVLEETDGQ